MSTIYHAFEYIHFTLAGGTGKTSVWACRNNKSGAELGLVRWNGAWRQYCYYPSADAVYSEGCLKDIAVFLDQVNTAHRAKVTA